MNSPYIIVSNSELKEVEKTVNVLIEQGYTPQPMVVIPAVSGATSYNRYAVPMFKSESSQFTEFLARLAGPPIGEE